MVSVKRNLVVALLLLGIGCGCLAATVSTASALASPTYNLGVSAGDWVVYNVDQQNTTWGLNFRQGDRITVYLDHELVIRLIDKAGNEILGYEVPFYLMYANDSPFLPSIDFQIIFRLTDVFPTVAPGPFFYPVGPGRLWKALEDCFPKLQAIVSGNQIILVHENFLHWTVEGDGLFEYYYYEFTRILIDAGTGVATRLEYSREANGQVESVVMSLVEAHISSSPVLALLSQYWYVVFPPILGLAAVLIYASRSRSRVRRHRKEEILGRLSDEKLLKLARTVLGEKARAGMGRANLLETVKNSLSLEEIKRRIRE
ncbi:MAG: hypothetical protein WED04_10335 [Promethearchaeati archaeon SRVP18_Atabeyarchaeia-1]